MDKQMGSWVPNVRWNLGPSSLDDALSQGLAHATEGPSFCFIKVFIFHFPFFLNGSYYLVEICKIGKLSGLTWFIFGMGNGKKGKFCIVIPFFLKDACGIVLYCIV